MWTGRRWEVSQIHSFPFCATLLHPLTSHQPGFVCAATVPTCEYHKLGQLKPGDKIRYRRMTLEEAVQRRQQQDRMIAALAAPHAASTAERVVAPVVLKGLPSGKVQLGKLISVLICLLLLRFSKSLCRPVILCSSFLL